MSTERVTVRVDGAGRVTVEAHGVVGSGCEALTKPMRDALGVSGDSQKKPEFFAAQSNSQTQVQR